MKFPDDKQQHCGYMWFSTKWFEKLLGVREPFYAACMVHDERYKEKSTTRLEAAASYYRTC